MKPAVRILAMLLLLSCVQAHAERPYFSLAFDGLFDNREFKNDMLPQTIYGMRITPQIGIRHESHSLTAGISKIWEFGSDGRIVPDVILYYGVHQDAWSGYFGSVPRTRLQRQLPDCMLYDSIAFFESCIGGTVIQYCGRLLQTELYCNWTGRQSQQCRESFRIVSDGLVGRPDGLLSGGWFLTMTHYAKPKEPGHFIYEQLQFNPYLSVSLGSCLSDGLYARFQAGALACAQRCRRDGDWHLPAGFLGSAEAGWHRFSLSSLVYAGQAQQKFLDDPEAGLDFHRCDPFYNHSFYSRNSFEYCFLKDRMVELSFRWNVHITPSSPIHNQQMIVVKYCLDSDRSRRQ